MTQTRLEVRETKQCMTGIKAGLVCDAGSDIKYHVLHNKSKTTEQNCWLWLIRKGIPEHFMAFSYSGCEALLYIFYFYIAAFIFIYL